jgi:hypothetical protein
MTVYQLGNQDLDLAIEYDASDRELYVGECRPGAVVASNAWRIFKLFYDGTSDRVTRKRFADGTPEFDKCWDDRATYSYVE